MLSFTEIAEDPSFPEKIKSPLYDNLGKDESLAIRTDKVIRESRQSNWRTNPLRTKAIRLAIKPVLGSDDELLDRIMSIVQQQDEY